MVEVARRLASKACTADQVLQLRPLNLTIVMGAPGSAAAANARSALTLSASLTCALTKRPPVRDVSYQPSCQMPSTSCPTTIVLCSPRRGGLRIAPASRPSAPPQAYERLFAPLSCPSTSANFWARYSTSDGENETCPIARGPFSKVRPVTCIRDRKSVV